MRVGTHRRCASSPRRWRGVASVMMPCCPGEAAVALPVKVSLLR